MPASAQSLTPRLPPLYSTTTGACSGLKPPPENRRQLEYEIDLQRTLHVTNQAYHRVVGVDNSQKRIQNSSERLIHRVKPLPRHGSFQESSAPSTQEGPSPFSKPAFSIGPQLPGDRSSHEPAHSSEPAFSIGPQLPGDRSSHEPAHSSEPAFSIGPQLPGDRSSHQPSRLSNTESLVSSELTTTKRSAVSASQVSIDWSKEELRILTEMCSKRKTPLGKELSEKLPKKTLQAIRNRIEVEEFFKGSASRWSKKELEEFEKLHSSNKERPTISELALAFPCRTRYALKAMKKSMHLVGKAHKKWLPEEIETLQGMYSDGKTPTDEELLEALPNRHIRSIHTKRKELNLGETGPEKWSQQDLRKLHKMVSKIKKPSEEKLCETFPSRSIHAIKLQVCKLGTKVLKKKKWSEKEDQLLESMCCSKKTPSEKDFLEAFTGRTTEDIQLRRFSLNLIKFPPKKWTEKEVKKLRAMYSRKKNLSFEELHSTFPERTYNSILGKKKELKIGNNLHWSQAEDEKLIDMHSEGKTPSSDMLRKAFPGRTYDAIGVRKIKLGLSKKNQVKWTPQEKKRLKEMCSNERNPSDEELSQAFPERTLQSINSQKSRLKLSKQKVWTKKEIAKLRSLFSRGTKPLEAELHATLPGRTMDAAQSKLRKLLVK